MSLRGKVALVTGASKGIGRGLAVGLARNGASVVVNYKSDAEGAEETRRQVISEFVDDGRECVSLQADVSDPAAATALIDAVVERFGRVDVLVNNAGRSRFGPAVDVTTDAWDEVVDTNLRGTFFTSTAAARHMQAAGINGSIVNVSSCAAHLMVVHHSLYTMSKRGIEALTQQLAIELAPSIRVNAVAPGATSGERARSYDPDFDAHWGSVIPMGRVLTPEDVVGPVVFLASDAAVLVTGDIVHVDGGWSIQGMTPPMDEFDYSADDART